MTREEMIESLRLCARCGHTRDRHAGPLLECMHRWPDGAPSGARVASFDPRLCDCAHFEPGRLSTEGLRALHRREDVDGFIEALGPHPMEVPC